MKKFTIYFQSMLLQTNLLKTNYGYVVHSHKLLELGRIFICENKLPRFIKNICQKMKDIPFANNRNNPSIASLNNEFIKNLTIRKNDFYIYNNYSIRNNESFICGSESQFFETMQISGNRFGSDFLKININ